MPFFLFLSEERPKIKKEAPLMSPQEVCRRAGENWRKLDIKEKGEYLIKSAQAKTRYNEGKQTRQEEKIEPTEEAQ